MATLFRVRVSNGHTTTVIYPPILCRTLAVAENDHLDINHEVGEDKNTKQCEQKTKYYDLYTACRKHTSNRGRKTALGELETLRSIVGDDY